MLQSTELQRVRRDLAIEQQLRIIIESEDI